MEIMKSTMKFFEGHVAKCFVTLLLCCFFTLTLSAQNYLEHLQQNVQGLGTVSVTQSKEISDLVNGTLPAEARNRGKNAAAKQSCQG